MMRFQNLNEAANGSILGSALWSGRSWVPLGKRELRIEWNFGSRTKSCRATFATGAGEDNDGVQVALAVPFLFSLWITLAGFRPSNREREFGFAVHNNCIWLYPGYDPMGGWSRDMSWWEKCHSWAFPWDLSHFKTEILEHKANIPGLAKTVLISSRKLQDFAASQATRNSVSETYPYRYTLKSGEVQKRLATVYVDRMTWRARWWPLIPIAKVRTSINIQFDGEVGEGAGSWKGGCTGCGWDILSGETPFEALRRMEASRTFSR